MRPCTGVMPPCQRAELAKVCRADVSIHEHVAIRNGTRVIASRASNDHQWQEVFCTGVAGASRWRQLPLGQSGVARIGLPIMPFSTNSW